MGNDQFNTIDMDGNISVGNMLYRYSYWNMLYHRYEWEYVGNNWEYYQYINGNNWEYIYQMVIIPLQWLM